MVTTIVAVLVDGAVNEKVVGSNVMLLPAVIVAVPVIPAKVPVPMKVTGTDPISTVMVTVPHLTIS